MVKAYALLAAALLAQAVFSTHTPRDWRADTSPGPAPTTTALRLVSFGETAAAAYGMNLYVQTFDAQAGAQLSLRKLDQPAIRSWLARATELAPDSGYALFLATRMYAETAAEPDARALLNWVEQAFEANPNARWQWLAHAVYVAKHHLHDARLAQRYARALREQATDPAVPQWARDMEIFLLADLNELEAARALLGGLIASGAVADERELAVLAARLSEIEKRQMRDAVLKPEPALP